MEGQTLKLWCEVSGIKDPPASRTLTAWKKLPEGRIITDKFPRYKMRLGKYLRIRNVKPEDRGTYVCIASNLHGEITQEIRLVVLESSTTSRTLQITDSSTALHITAKEPEVPSTTNLPTHKGSVRPSSMPPLIVGRPPKFRNPSNRSSEYTQGSPMRLKCHANGEAPLNITWLKDGSILSRADEKLLKSKGRVLNFHKLSSSQAGSYMCIVTNAFGTIVKTFDIKVVGVAPPAEQKPRILKKDLKNETARPGDDATFVCSAISRGYPKFHFLKWKPPENVSNGSDPFDFVDFRKSKFREIHEVAKPHMGSQRIYTHRLVIYNVTSADEAKYTCMVGNSAGWVNKHAFLTVDGKGLPLSRKPEASPGEHPAATKKPIVSESPSYKELAVEEVPLAALICVPIAVVLFFMVTIVWCYFITRKLHSGKNSKNIDNDAFRQQEMCVVAPQLNAQRRNETRNVSLNAYVDCPNANIQSPLYESVSELHEKYELQLKQEPPLEGITLHRKPFRTFSSRAHPCKQNENKEPE
ncbi:fibroblast growth factor receptor-like 1 isoform X2 [Montipora foliosa]